MSTVQPPGRPSVQLDSPDETQHRQQMARAINRINSGHLNCTLYVTLEPGAAQTTVTDSRISQQTAFIFHPTTPDAAADAAGGKLYAVCTNGSATIHHAVSAQTDRTFTLGMVG